MFLQRTTRTAKKSRKLQLTDGLQIAFIDWQEIKELTGCSRSTAYRWIDRPESMPVPMYELLLLTKLGAVPHIFVQMNDTVNKKPGN